MNKTISAIRSKLSLAHPIFILMFLTACASTYENPYLTNLVSESDYFSSIKLRTKSEKVYDGFAQTLGMSATLLDSKTSQAQVDHRARIFQWEATEYANKKAEMETENSKQTVIFLSFFVPDRKHDNLHKPSSVWKIFLDVNGKRYEGKAEKIKMVLAEIQRLYPHHTRFQSAYKVSFPVPVSMTENTDSTFTMTGPVSSVKLIFPATQL